MSAVLVAARRTAVVPRGGAFHHLEIHQLAAPAILACLTDAGLSADAVDELILGNALGAGGNPARSAALAADLPERVAGLSLDRQCCSGLDALLLAQAMVAAGQAEVVIAGGAESYSRRPLRYRTSVSGEAVAYDQARFTPWPDRDPAMGEAAATLAERLSISKTRQDQWAMQSHAKARAGQAAIRGEICTIAGAVVDSDPYRRRLSAALCRRAPVIFGSVTHANAAVAADAAAFCIVVSESVARRLGQPVVRLLGGATLGDDPVMPGLAPVQAICETMSRLGLGPDDFASAEIMEAYAVQALACIDGAGLDPARVNPKGGALARGHPIGASGAVLAVRLFHDLIGTRERGLAAIAAAGGLGTALALQGDS